MGDGQVNGFSAQLLVAQSVGGGVAGTAYTFSNQDFIDGDTGYYNLDDFATVKFLHGTGVLRRPLLPFLARSRGISVDERGELCPLVVRILENL